MCCFEIEGTLFWNTVVNNTRTWLPRLPVSLLSCHRTGDPDDEHSHPWSLNRPPLYLEAAVTVDGKAVALLRTNHSFSNFEACDKRLFWTCTDRTFSLHFLIVWFSEGSRIVEMEARVCHNEEGGPCNHACYGEGRSGRGAGNCWRGSPASDLRWGSCIWAELWKHKLWWHIHYGNVLEVVLLMHY